jgi:hypothetical protein
MGIKVIRDFQQGDDVVIRLEFEGGINLTGNIFNITLASNLNSTPEYDVNFTANTNAHPDDVIVGGIINLVVDTTALTANNYLYSISRTDSSGYVTTLARSGLNSVDMVECKKKI